jgi:hypothetical protein
MGMGYKPRLAKGINITAGLQNPAGNRAKELTKFVTNRRF